MRQKSGRAGKSPLAVAAPEPAPKNGLAGRFRTGRRSERPVDLAQPGLLVALAGAGDQSDGTERDLVRHRRPRPAAEQLEHPAERGGAHADHPVGHLRRAGRGVRRPLGQTRRPDRHQPDPRVYRIFVRAVRARPQPDAGPAVPDQLPVFDGRAVFRTGRDGDDPDARCPTQAVAGQQPVSSHVHRFAIDRAGRARTAARQNKWASTGCSSAWRRRS